MGHGNFSDLCFLVLFGGAIQSIFYTETLFQDFGPIKANFSNQSAEVETMIKFSGGLFLIVAMMLSGVKWNPANGKMSGMGCFLAAFNTAYITYTADAGVIVPRPFYIYAVTLFLAGVHVFLFPSNPMPPKTDATKNNHGNMSDKVALFLIAASIQSVFFPNYELPVVTLQDQFSSQAQSAELTAMIKHCGGLILIVAMMLSGVKWNPANGKMSGMGCFLAAFNAAYITYTADAGVFVPRPFYVYAAALFLAGVHVFLFPSNPMPPKAKPKGN